MKKPAKKQPSNLTVNALAAQFGFDRRTIRKRLTDAGFYPPSGHPRARVLEAIQPAGEPGGSSSKSALERRRLRLQCARLEVALARERGEVLSVETGEAMLAELGSTIMSLLRQKLENEWPVSCAGLEPAEIRVKGKALVDDIAGRLQKAVEPWETKP